MGRRERALARMSAATIDRRLAGERAKLLPRMAVPIPSPGSLLKSQIPVRTWAEWDDAVPGFVEIDLVGHEGGEQLRRILLHPDSHGYRDRLDREPVRAEQGPEARLRSPASTSWRCSRFPSSASIRITASEFINNELFELLPCQHASPSPGPGPGNKNDGAHVEQKNWSRVRELVGYLRYDTAAELETAQRDLGAGPDLHQLPAAPAKTHRQGPPRSQSEQEPTTATATPHQRAQPTRRCARMPVIRMNACYKKIRPAAISRQILALTGRLETIATAKQPAPIKPAINERVEPVRQPEDFI